MGKKGKSICLFSSKGGTGKSSIATLLSGYGGKIGLIGSIIAIVVNSAIYMINERKIDVEAVNKVIKLSVDDFNEIKKLVNEYKENEKDKN